MDPTRLSSRLNMHDSDDAAQDAADLVALAQSQAIIPTAHPERSTSWAGFSRP
jgi:hypothetical protein